MPADDAKPLADDPLPAYTTLAASESDDAVSYVPANEAKASADDTLLAYDNCAFTADDN